MRTWRVAVASAVVLVLLGGISAGGAEVVPEELPTAAEEDPYGAAEEWALMRDGVFVDAGDWERTFLEFDARDKQQAQKLRRRVRNQRAHMDIVDGHACFAEAYDAVLRGAELLDEGLTDLLKGRRGRGETRFWRGQEHIVAYWQLRDEVECSSVGVTDVLGDALFTPVTGRRIELSSYDASEEDLWDEDDVGYASGAVTSERFEWSDPRLPAAFSSRMSMADFAPGKGWPGAVIISSLLLEGPEGFWTGTGYAYADEGSVGHGTWVLTGHGAYEGLSAILLTTDEAPAPYCVECLTVEGAIFGGPLPSIPEPLEPMLGAMPDADEPTPDPYVAPPTEPPALPLKEQAAE